MARFANNVPPRTCPTARVKPFFDCHPVSKAALVRVTAKFFVLAWNDRHEDRWHREGPRKGEQPGAYSRMNMTPSTLENVDELEAFVQAQGGRWDCGWRPLKERPCPTA